MLGAIGASPLEAAVDFPALVRDAGAASLIVAAHDLAVGEPRRWPRRGTRRAAWPVGAAPCAKWFGAALLVAAFVMPFTPFADQKTMDLAVLILTYVMLGWGLNIVVGLAGLLDLGYVAFYAVGAYSYALLSTQYRPGLLGRCLPLAGMLAATLRRCCWAFPVLRLRGDYLAIVTLGFGEIIRLVLLNWVDLTSGPAGIGSIPRPDLVRRGVRARPRPPAKQTFAEMLRHPLRPATSA